jgi:hypothetical protein
MSQRLDAPLADSGERLACTAGPRQRASRLTVLIQRLTTCIPELVESAKAATSPSPLGSSLAFDLPCVCLIQEGPGEKAGRGGPSAPWALRKRERRRYGFPLHLTCHQGNSDDLFGPSLPVRRRSKRRRR